jgi:hypothetical protein
MIRRRKNEAGSGSMNGICTVCRQTRGNAETAPNVHQTRHLGVHLAEDSRRKRTHADEADLWRTQIFVRSLADRHQLANNRAHDISHLNTILQS